MIIYYKNWRIKKHNYHGYLLQKKVGKQWKDTTYYSTLGITAKNLFEYETYEQLSVFEVDLTQTKNAKETLDALGIHLESIKSDIQEAIDGKAV